ncbi:hypothetical protein FOL46_001530 [Perkinsus olseni]|uniref:Uncharacterized protein n=1 Tax=Perkinsus olseni TaxID=32597 RepID=A0A7J6MDP8_PEROL|nr:hypothetical protein FOL46_001530 [Perkinsus olseni]
MQYFGIEELRACVSHDIECAARLRGMLQADEVTNESLVGPAEVDIPRWISWEDEWDFVGFLNLEADESPASLKAVANLTRRVASTFGDDKTAMFKVRNSRAPRKNKPSTDGCCNYICCQHVACGVQLRAILDCSVEQTRVRIYRNRELHSHVARQTAVEESPTDEGATDGKKYVKVPAHLHLAMEQALEVNPNTTPTQLYDLFLRPDDPGCVKGEPKEATALRRRYKDYCANLKRVHARRVREKQLETVEDLIRE